MKLYELGSFGTGGGASGIVMFSRSRRRSFISMLMRVSRSLRVRSLPISLPSSAHSPSVQMQYCSESITQTKLPVSAAILRYARDYTQQVVWYLDRKTHANKTIFVTTFVLIWMSSSLSFFVLWQIILAIKYYFILGKHKTILAFNWWSLDKCKSNILSPFSLVLVCTNFWENYVVFFSC